MGKNLKMGPSAEKKFEKLGLEKMFEKWDIKSVGPQQPLKRLIHMYPVTEFGRSKSGPFVIDDYFFVTVFNRRSPVEDNTT